MPLLSPGRPLNARKKLAQRLATVSGNLLAHSRDGTAQLIFSDHGADASVLLGLRKACESTLRGSADPLTTVVAFTLSAMVADLSRNLFVDAQYSPSLERGRLEILGRIATSLEFMSSALETGNSIATLAALTDLVHFYAGLLTRLIDMEEARYGYAI